MTTFLKLVSFFVVKLKAGKVPFPMKTLLEKEDMVKGS
uniref:Uncharacterized protein n=1 Tax=Rhizophora mucronata TaxID=61149 RepID=A0A2P2Q0D3_RHIMU